MKIDFKQLKMGNRGIGAIDTLIGLVAGIMVVVALLYAMIQLGTSLNNSNVTAVVNNTATGVVNFSSQLGTLGTLLGVGLFIAVILGAIYFGGRMSRGGGSGM